VSRQNTSRFAILGILTWDAMSGYDIKKWVESSISNFWSESYGQIYPILKGLVADGWAAVTVEPQAGKPNRHVYAITEAGQAALREWLALPIEHQTGRSELLLKLFFGTRAPTAENIRHVQQFRDRQVELLRKYDDIEHWLDKTMRDEPGADYWQITLRYGQHSARALLAWCDETLERLAKRKA